MCGGGRSWSLQQLLLGAQRVLGVQAEITLWQLAGSEGQSLTGCPWPGQSVSPHMGEPTPGVQEEKGQQVFAFSQLFPCRGGHGGSLWDTALGV